MPELTKKKKVGRKTPDNVIERRRRRVLEILILKQEVTLDELATYCTESGYPIATRTIRTFMNNYYLELSAQKFPVEWNGKNMSLRTMEMAERWKGTQVGKKLKKESEITTKGTLATKVVDYLRGNRNQVRSILLSSGTTVYKVADEILLRQNELEVVWIHTTSMLVLDAFLFSRPLNMKLLLLGNEFNSTTGALKDIDYAKLSKLSVDASIISFTGLSKKGFYVDEDWEIEEMFSLLRPNIDCRLILIPIGWEKIDCKGGYLVESQGIAGDAVLDFPIDELSEQTNREYVLVTNPPSGIMEEDPRKKAVIDFWKKKGMKVEPV